MSFAYDAFKPRESPGTRRKTQAQAGSGKTLKVKLEPDLKAAEARDVSNGS